MNIVFYLSALVAIVSTIMVITRTNAMHALLYLIVSLLSAALMFFTLGAPFIAALEVIVYAGAIMVLFIFAIMLLNQGPQSVEMERKWLRGLRSSPGGWIGPAVLSLVLLGELVYVLASGPSTPGTPGTAAIEPAQVGVSLFTTYLIGVELSSILLLASLVGAFHLGRRHQVTRAVERREVEIDLQKEFKEPVQDFGDNEKTASEAAAAQKYAVGKEQ